MPRSADQLTPRFELGFFFFYSGILDSETESSVTLSSHDYAALLKRLRDSEARGEILLERHHLLHLQIDTCGSRNRRRADQITRQPGKE